MISRKKSFPFLHLLLTFAALAAFLLGLRLLDRAFSGERLMLTERSVRQAAVQCYALEGFYPESLGYLADRYGLQIDKSRFFIHYDYVAANLPPDITVLPIGR